MTHFDHTERKLGVGRKNDFELDFNDGFLLGFTHPCVSFSSGLEMKNLKQNKPDQDKHRRK